MATPQPVPVPAIPTANATYSQAVRLGDLIFLSGQLGIDPKTGRFASEEIRGQTRQALDNITAVLAAAGSSLDRVARVNIYIRDFAWLPAMNEIYAKYFPHRPAKTTVEVSGLHMGGLIEIEVVAGA